MTLLRTLRGLENDRNDKKLNEFILAVIGPQTEETYVEITDDMRSRRTNKEAPGFFSILLRVGDSIGDLQTPCEVLNERVDSNGGYKQPQPG